VRERIAAAVEVARRYTPAAPALEEIDRILRDGNGADRMRAAHAEGGMPRVLHRLIEESAEALGVPARAA
jgi:carboxylate-amine ligase